MCGRELMARQSQNSIIYIYIYLHQIYEFTLFWKLHLNTEQLNVLQTSVKFGLQQ